MSTEFHLHAYIYYHASTTSHASWHSSTHHYITTLLFLAVNRHDALSSSLQHHGARLMGNDKDLPAHSLHPARNCLD